MPKNQKKKKNSKNKSSDVEKRALLLADIDGQVYGCVEKALGARFFTIKCLDKIDRRCKVRNKRMRIKTGDIVIISLRDYDDKNGDIIYKYDEDEVRTLQKNGTIPSNEYMGKIEEEGEDDDDGGVFDFEDI